MNSCIEDMLMENSLLKWFILKNIDSREFGVHPINKNRIESGNFCNLYQELRQYPENFFEYLRMKPETFDYILSLISSHLRKKWGNIHKNPIQPEERLVITIRYLATGASFRALAFEFRMGFSTIAKIVKECVDVLWDILQPIHMSAPTKDDFLKIAEDFLKIWNFPHCIGAIDGKHIRINCPEHSGTMYYNYKHFYSIVLQAVVDANYRFTIIDVGAYGKQSDGGTFRDSVLFQMLENSCLNVPDEDSLPKTNIKMPYVFIGDEAYPLLNNLMKPYSRQQLTPDNECFNKRLSRARKSVECAFGIIYSNWRILSKAIETNENTADKIVKAICVLHNTILDKEPMERHLMEVHSQEIPETCEVHPNRKVGRPTESSKDIRETFKKYVCQNRVLY